MEISGIALLLAPVLLLMIQVFPIVIAPLTKKKRGFAAMKAPAVTSIARLGGLARSRDRKSMARAGRKGALARWGQLRKVKL